MNNSKNIMDKYFNNMFIEYSFCLTKFIIFMTLIYEYGLFYALIIGFVYSCLSSLILKKIFGLVKLNPNDLLLLGFDNTERNVMICTFFFENRFDPKKIQEILLNGVKLHEKLQMTLVRKFSFYFWQKVTFQQAEKRVRILEKKINNKNDVVEYLRDEINNEFELDKEMPYEFQLVKYSSKEGGAIIFKLDHTLSDGLGMMSFTLTLCDKYDDSFYPKVLKNNNSSMIKKILFNIGEFFLFPYYSAKFFLNSRYLKSQKNPFTRTPPPSGKSVFGISNIYNFNKIHEVSKKLNITFNDLMLCVISSSINKLCNNIYPERKYEYEHLICGIPIGLKNIPKNVSEVGISNDILGSVLKLKRINDPLKDFKLINDELKNTVKNAFYTKSLYHVFTLMNEFIPYRIQKELSKKVADDCDVCISNMPGPIKKLSYSGCEVDDILPMNSVGYSKAFIIIGSYNNQVNIVANIDKKLDIDINLLINTIEHELDSILEKEE